MKNLNWEKVEDAPRKKSLLRSMLGASLLSGLISTIILTLTLFAYWSKETGMTLSGLDVIVSIAIGFLGMAGGFIITLPLILISYFMMSWFLKRGRRGGVILWILCSLIVVLPFVNFPIELKSKFEIIENPLSSYLSMLLLPTSLLTGFLSWLFYWHRSSNNKKQTSIGN